MEKMEEIKNDGNKREECKKRQKQVKVTTECQRWKNEKGDKCINNYLLKEKLGQGSFSKVYRVGKLN